MSTARVSAKLFKASGGVNSEIKPTPQLLAAPVSSVAILWMLPVGEFFFIQHHPTPCVRSLGRGGDSQTSVAWGALALEELRGYSLTVPWAPCWAQGCAQTPGTAAAGSRPAKGGFCSVRCRAGLHASIASHPINHQIKMTELNTLVAAGERDKKPLFLSFLLFFSFFTPT